MESLRHQVAERQQRVSELQAMMESCAEERLRPLLQEMAALQVTRVLHGDYDLKIARQDAIIHKQDQVSHLTGCLSVCLSLKQVGLFCIFSKKHYHCT